MAVLYAAVAKVSGARIVVDSSKQPQDAYLTTWNPGVEMFAVHLVRDPRGVAYSFAKKVPEPQPDLDYMPRSGAFGTALRWSVRHAFAEGMLKRRLRERYLRLRYEDFVADPSQAVRNVAALAEQPVPPDETLNGARIDFPANHTFSGNPLRFRSDAIDIEPDQAWTAKMSSHDRVLASIGAAPLMRRYGYSRVPR
jgi:hypothetical protein